MCAGAILHARLQRVVEYPRAYDERAGAAGSVCDVFAMSALNHQTAVSGGLCHTLPRVTSTILCPTAVVMSLAITIHLQQQQLFVSINAPIHDCLLPDFNSKKGRRGTTRQLSNTRGQHYIRAKIGAHLPRAAVLVGRRWTGEVCDDALFAAQPERDWILSRILWLCGREVGKNRLGEVDTMARYIYIHGTPDAVSLSTPQSHGCIRMHNDDVIAPI